MTLPPNNLAVLQSYYLPLLFQHRNGGAAVGWGTNQNQQVRFRKLLELADIRDASVLDAGCGLGELAELLPATCRYKGIDVLPEMVAMGLQRHPHLDLEVGDISEGKWKVDYVLGSGIFSFASDDILFQGIKSMWEAASKGVAFNVMSEWSFGSPRGKNEYFADPLKVLAYCQQFTRALRLDHGYMPHDFTVFMYRREWHRLMLSTKEEAVEMLKGLTQDNAQPQS